MTDKIAAIDLYEHDNKRTIFRVGEDNVTEIRLKFDKDNIESIEIVYKTDYSTLIHNIYLYLSNYKHIVIEKA